MLAANVAQIQACFPEIYFACHLGRAKSALSAALKKLEANGLILLEPGGSDARRHRLRLTPRGHECISQTSVLETGALSSVLASMSIADQQSAVHGLQLLAAACRNQQPKGAA